jgi:hypothetical protein
MEIFLLKKYYVALHYRAIEDILMEGSSICRAQFSEGDVFGLFELRKHTCEYCKVMRCCGKTVIV